LEARDGGGSESMPGYHVALPTYFYLLEMEMAASDPQERIQVHPRKRTQDIRPILCSWRFLEYFGQSFL